MTSAMPLIGQHRPSPPHFFFTNCWSYLVEGLLSTGPTSFSFQYSLIISGQSLESTQKLILCRGKKLIFRKLYFWQNAKTWMVTKLRTWIGTKLKNSNPENSIPDKKLKKKSFVKNNLTAWQPMRCTLGSVLLSCTVFLICFCLFISRFILAWPSEILFQSFIQIFKKVFVLALRIQNIYIHSVFLKDGLMLYVVEILKFKEI